jgi:hypothetical protein
VSADGLAKRLDRLSTVCDTATRAAADAVTKIAEQEGGHVTLGKKKRRVKLSAVARVKGSGDHVEVTIWGRPTGPWVWVTSGTSPHKIPKRQPTAKKPRPMHGKGYEHPVQRMQLQHHGAHGKGAWTQVQKRAGRVVPEIFKDQVKKVLHG